MNSTSLGAIPAGLAWSLNEVKRIGKVVYVAFLYDHGLSPALRLVSDECFRLDEFLCKQWQPEQEHV